MFLKNKHYFYQEVLFICFVVGVIILLTSSLYIKNGVGARSNDSQSMRNYARLQKLSTGNLGSQGFHIRKRLLLKLSSI